MNLANSNLNASPRPITSETHLDFKNNPCPSHVLLPGIHARDSSGNSSWKAERVCREEKWRQLRIPFLEDISPYSFQLSAVLERTWALLLRDKNPHHNENRHSMVKHSCSSRLTQATFFSCRLLTNNFLSLFLPLSESQDESAKCPSFSLNIHCTRRRQRMAVGSTHGQQIWYLVVVVILTIKQDAPFEPFAQIQI